MLWVLNTFVIQYDTVFTVIIHDLIDIKLFFDKEVYFNISWPYFSYE